MPNPFKSENHRYTFDVPEEYGPLSREEREEMYAQTRKEDMARRRDSRTTGGKVLLSIAMIGGSLLSFTRPEFQHVISPDVHLTYSQAFLTGSLILSGLMHMRLGKR